MLIVRCQRGEIAMSHHETHRKRFAVRALALTRRLSVVDDNVHFCEVVRGQARSWGMEVDVGYPP